MKQSILKKTLSVLLCLSLVAGFLPPVQVQSTTYEVNLNRGISLVPQDLLSNETFMSRFVRNDGETLNLNSLFQRVGSSNVKNAGSTLSTKTMKRNKSGFWWAKYQWTPNDVQKQYLADSNYPLIYEGNVIPDYCTHLIAEDHWCAACIRFNNDDEWTFGVNDYGYDPNGKLVWSAISSNSGSGTPQAVKKQIDSIVPEDGTLTYAAYSQWKKDCGDPQVGGSVFYMVDTTAPYITDVSISGGGYQSLSGGDVKGTVTLTFSEDIRFANNKVPNGLKLNLDAYYGSQAGSGRNENTSYKLSADFVSLAGNVMTFSFTVPKSVNHIYITGISNTSSQPILQACDLYVYDGSGKQITNTSLTSPTMITDLSGNYLRWDKSDKSCSTVTYDGVAPTLKQVVMSGPDITNESTKDPTSWDANSGNNQYVYAGVGDKISFTVTYSEDVDVPSDAKAVLSITDASGEPVKLGIKSHRGNTVVFEELTITEDMLDAGERIVIDSFENMTVTDYAGNALSGSDNMAPSQNITLDVDKPIISTKLTATDGVYTPDADEVGEYFTFPLLFADAENGSAAYSGISGKPISFTLEMLDGDAYGYKWYIDNTQTVDKNAQWATATTGTTKNTVADIASGEYYYLHIWLDKNTDYNYTADGGMDASGIYFNGRLTVYAEDWAGNQADPASFVLKHQVDTEAPSGGMLSSLTVIPSYSEGEVTFKGSFRVTDNYSIEKISYQWYYKLGDATEFTPSEVTTITDVGTGLNTVVSETVSDTYNYNEAGAALNGAVYLRVTVEDRLGRSHTFTSNVPQFNFEKASSNSSVEVNTAATPVTQPVVNLAKPQYSNDMTTANTPRTILMIPDTRNAGSYWIYDPWAYSGTYQGYNYGTDPISALFAYMESSAVGSYQSLWRSVPGHYYYVTGEVDLQACAGSFTNVKVLQSSGSETETGSATDLRNYIRDYYGPMELYLVTTSSLAEFDSSTLTNSSFDFSSLESIIDTYTVYLAGDIDYEVQNIIVENEDVLSYTSGKTAKSLDSASVSFQIVNATDTDTVQYGLDFVDYANTNVKLYYLGTNSNGTITENTPVVQTWDDITQSSDGVYTFTVEPGKCAENGWYAVVLTLPNSYTGETKTITLGKLFLDATVLDITLDGYYKEYFHEEIIYPDPVAWDVTGLEASYAEGSEIVLGLDTEPEGWTMSTYLTFHAGGRSKESDALYWTSFDVQPRVRVYNHTYNALAGLEDASSGIWLDTDGREGTTLQYVPYVAAADAEEPYGAADALKLPFVEGYNVLVYEIESINGVTTTKEITVNVFGQAEEWELDTVISSTNGIGVNSVTASARCAASDSFKFSYLGSSKNYASEYVFTRDMDVTFYLIDDQGNLSAKDFALRDENGELVDIDGEGPAYVGFTSANDPNEYNNTSATFHFTVYAYDADSAMSVKDLTLTFDADYSALLMGLAGEEREANTQQITMSIPLALDENGELLKNEDGTYAVWESYDTSHNGIYRTQVLYEGPYSDPDSSNFDYEGAVSVEIWGTWKYDPEYDYSTSQRRTLTVTAVDSYGNAVSNDRTYYAGAHEYWFTAATLDEEGEVNGDLGAVNAEGALGLASDMPFAAINGYGAGKQIETIYSYYGYRQFYTTAPMIVEDGIYTFRVTDLFGDEHDVEVYVYAFGELGIDVSFSTTEPTNQSVTVTAQATGEYDKITSITSDNGDVGEIDTTDSRNATITVSDNCAITIETEDGQSRTVKVSNIDKVLGEVRIVYYDQRYEVLDPSTGAEAVTAQLVCDTEVVYVTNGPDSYEFPLGSKQGDTYTFEYQDRAGNTGSITATLPCDLTDPPSVDETAPDILVNLYALVGGRYNVVANVANPDDGSELNGYLAEGKAQSFRLVFSINDASATKVLVQPTGTAAPTDYASAEQGSTVENVTLSVSGRSATITVSENATFDVHIIDESGNVKSVPGISITTIDNSAPVLTPRYEVGTDENGYTVVTATFYPSEEEKYEVITPLSSDVLGKQVQIAEEVVDEETGETVPVMATRYYHIFTENGTYSFTYQDEMGNLGTAVAEVRNLNTKEPVISQVNWYGTKATSGRSNVTPDMSGMVNWNIVAQLRMNMAISDVKLYAYDPDAENFAGEPLDPTLPVSVGFTASIIELTYTGNVGQQILVEFTASASGRRGYYVLDAVNCIDKEAPVVTVTGAQMASDNRSMIITFTTDEETVMTSALIPFYGTVHTWIATDHKPAKLQFTDKAGNQTVYTVTQNADVDTLELAAQFSLDAEGTNPTADPLNDLKLDVGATLYVKVNKKAEVKLGETALGTMEADTWTTLVLPESAGLHILSLTDVNTGELLQILVAAQPKDNVAPVIELEGGTILVTEDATVEELLAVVHSGVTVTDNVDQNPGYTVTGYPDAVEVGLYALTYTATDAAGNVSSITRTLYIMAEGAPLLKINGEVGVPYGKVFLKNGGESTDITLELINMEDMTDQPLVIKYRKGENTTGQMKYYATTVENMKFTVTETGHYTIYVRSQDRVEFVIYFYVEG